MIKLLRLAAIVAATAMVHNSAIASTAGNDNDPEFQTISFAGIIGQTDAVIEICRLKPNDWLDLRSQAIDLLPKLAKKSGWNGDLLPVVEQGKQEMEGFHRRSENIPECGALSKDEMLNRQLRNMRGWLSWARAYLEKS